MLDLIGKAMGKPIPGGDATFWAALSSAGLAHPPETIQPAAIDIEADGADEEMEFDELGEAVNTDEYLAADA